MQLSYGRNNSSRGPSQAVYKVGAALVVKLMHQQLGLANNYNKDQVSYAVYLA